jgi:hypothetical protein
MSHNSTASNDETGTVILFGDRAKPPELRAAATDARVRAPRLYCPFAPAIHADAVRIEEATIAWMKRFGYIRTLDEEEAARRAQFGIRAARVHPIGDTAAIELVSDLTVWLFLTDDAYVEQAGASQAISITTDHIIRCIRVLRDAEDMPSDASASLIALQNISRRLRVVATPEQLDRLIGGMIEFFLAACCEAVAIARKQLPSAETYIPVRDAINCLRTVCFVFIEIVGGYQLPAAVWCRPDLQAIVDKAVRIVSNHHDVLSGLRELGDETPMNLPSVLALEHELPIDKAFECVGALADSDTRMLVRMLKRLRAEENDPAVLAYLDGLEAWIRGNLDWSLTTGRYRVQEFA